MSSDMHECLVAFNSIHICIVIRNETALHIGTPKIITFSSAQNYDS